MESSQNQHGTVLVTGASGFVAKHTIKFLLLKTSYIVRGTVRNDEEADVARAAVSTYFDEDTSNSRFTLVKADLTHEEDWPSAIQGCRFVLHIASPYPLRQPKNREALVPIAKDGTLRIVRAALDNTTCERIIVTSSIQAMMYRPNRPVVVHLTENDWTDPEWKYVSTYGVSKTRAELAVWDLVKEKNATNKVVVVHPGMIWGPVMDNVQCTSSEIAKLFLTGAYPLAPPVSYPIVDVRDVAKVLVASMTAKGVEGRRLMASGGTLSFHEMCMALRKACPDHAKNVPTHVLPKLVLRLVAIFDRALRNTLPDINCRVEADTKYVTELTGVEFHSGSEAVGAMAQSLVENGVV